MKVKWLPIAPWLALACALPLAACALLVGDVDGHRLFLSDAGDLSDATFPEEGVVPPADATSDATDELVGDGSTDGDNVRGDRDSVPEAASGDASTTPYGGTPIVLASREARPTGIVATQGALYWVDSDNLTLRQLARESGGRLPGLFSDGGSAAVTATSMATMATSVSDLVTDGQNLYLLSSGGNCFLYMSAPLPITGGFGCGYPDGVCKVTRIATDYASPSSLVLDVMMLDAATTTSDCPATSFPSVLFQQTPVQHNLWRGAGAFDAGAPQALAANGQSIFYGLPSTTSFTNGAFLYEQSRMPPFSAKSLGQSIGPTVTDIVVDAASVYWADSAGFVYSAPIGGGSPYQSLAGTSLTPPPSRLALDDANVYWVSTGTPSTSGFVGMVSKHGGTPVKLAINLSQPYALAVDASGLYWTNSGDGSVMMLLPTH